jgi:hypothetical protein
MSGISPSNLNHKHNINLSPRPKLGKLSIAGNRLILPKLNVVILRLQLASAILD